MLLELVPGQSNVHSPSLLTIMRVPFAPILLLAQERSTHWAKHECEDVS